MTYLNKVRAKQGRKTVMRTFIPFGITYHRVLKLTHLPMDG